MRAKAERRRRVPPDRESGRASVVQLVLVVLAVVSGYLGVKYLPVLSDKSTMNGIAQQVGAKIVVEPDDGKLREEVARRAKEHDIAVGPSDVTITRMTASSPVNAIDIRWTQQVGHLNGKVHVMRMKVRYEVEIGTFQKWKPKDAGN